MIKVIPLKYYDGGFMTQALTEFVILLKKTKQFIVQLIAQKGI